MTVSDRDIELIELPPFTAFASASQTSPLRRQISVGHLAEVDSGTLLSFDASVDDQALADVSNSLLLAQLAADKQAEGLSNAQAWLAAFQNVMSTVGWGQTAVTVESQAAKPPVDWKRQVLSRMADRSVSLASASITAAAALPSASPAILVWNAATTTATATLFSIGVSRRVKGNVLLDLVTLGGSVNSASPTFLAWSPDYSLTLCSSRWELNEAVYAKVRQAIINKLGDRIHQLIVPIPLD